MIEISLTQNQVAMIDDEDYALVCQYKWCTQKSPTTLYAVSAIAWVNNKNVTMKMHRMIMNAQPNQDIDHIDGNGLNNQKENLRFCDESQNGGNRKKGPFVKNKPCSSKYKGVCWHKRDKKWQSQIKFSGNMYHLGYFENENDAALAYNERALELFGEFANLNEIQVEVMP